MDKIWHSILASTPERTKEIKNLIKTLNIQVEFGHDDRSHPLFQIMPPFDNECPYTLQLNHKTMLSFWIAGFSFTQMEAPIIFLLEEYRIKAKEQKILEVNKYSFDLKKIPYFQNKTFINLYTPAKKLMQEARELMFSDIFDGFILPKNIPDPNNGRPKDAFKAATFDMLVMGAAFLLLHELKHADIQKHTTHFNSRHEEEYACDDYATRFIVEKISNYKLNKKPDKNLVFIKRSLAILRCSACFLLFTQHNGFSKGQEHPPAINRLKKIKKIISSHHLFLGNDEELFWLHFNTILISIAIVLNLTIKPTTIYSHKEYSDFLITSLEEGFHREHLK